MAAPSAFSVEPLEHRLLMASHALVTTEVFSPSGMQLRIWGTEFRDDISVENHRKDGIVVTNKTWSKRFTGEYDSIWIDSGKRNDRIVIDEEVTIDAILFGQRGSDILLGGSGHDRLYGGTHNDILYGGDGEDVLVSVRGGYSDRLTGGNGRDSFWTDKKKNEVITDLGDGEDGSAHHRIKSFYNYQLPGSNPVGGPNSVAVPSSLKGQDLFDPTLDDARMTYRNFAGRPLFSREGPAMNDVKQGVGGDCYFMVALASIADLQPEFIRNHLVELGDGTYAVHFTRDSKNVFVRVDGDLPVWSWGKPAYASLGAENSLWVAVLEKAWAFFRYETASYNSIEAGWMSEIYDAFGIRQDTNFSVITEQLLMEQMQADLLAGKSVTLATRNVPENSPLIDQHAYTVLSTELDGDGNVIGVRLRNPWGVDGGPIQGEDDGYLSVTPAEIVASFWAVTTATV